MKNNYFIIALLLCLVYISCNSKGSGNSQESVQEKMSKYTGSAITNQLPDINRTYEYENKDSIHYSGFCSPIENEDKASGFVRTEKENFKEKGYLLFYFEDNDRKYYLGAIQSNDEMDILRWRGTDGINHDHTNNDIINKLKEWGKTNPIIVDGVSFDWVSFHFEKPVENVEQFANEVYEFCPDAVDQGVGTMEALKEAIKELNGVYLWWD